MGKKSKHKAFVLIYASWKKARKFKIIFAFSCGEGGLLFVMSWSCCQSKNAFGTEQQFWDS